MCIVILYRCNCYCFSSFISLQRLHRFLFIVYVVVFLSVFGIVCSLLPFTSIALLFIYFIPSLFNIYLPYVGAFMDTKTYTDTHLSYFIIIKVLRLYGVRVGFFFFIIIATIIINQISVYFVHCNITLWPFQWCHCNQCVLHCMVCIYAIFGQWGDEL